MTIGCKYSCALCGLKRVEIQLPARGEESVTDCMQATVNLVAKDHRRRSPHCRAKELTEFLIPTTGRDKIGGPSVQ